MPEDLIAEVVRRLPVKDMLRFRCVNKSWYRFIATSCFIKSTISNTSNPYLLYTQPLFYTLQDLSQEELFDDYDENLDYNGNLPDNFRAKYYYTTNLFGVNKKATDTYVKVYGICNGLLCVSEDKLFPTSRIYLWNPVIRKVKQIPMIAPAKASGPARDADLCFGYFCDDYKLVKIAPFDGNYSVGVYSLTTDAWKIKYCPSNYATFRSSSNPSSNKFVNGVAYFVNFDGMLVCFDLHHDKIREVQFPNKFHPQSHSFSVEAWGESIALIEYSDQNQNLTKWVLRNCAARSTSTWEKKVSIKLEADMYPLGITQHGKYLLRDDVDLDTLYLWDFGTSQPKECKSELGTQYLQAVDSLVGNLVLLDEKTLDPFVEKQPCSTQTMFVLYTTLEQRNRWWLGIDTGLDKRKKEIKEMKKEMEKKEKETKGRKEETEMENTRDTRNILQGRGTKRRKEKTEMEKPRKKERKEILDTTQNRLQGMGVKRRMEETQMEKPRKKGRKVMLYETPSILQGREAKRRRD